MTSSRCSMPSPGPNPGCAGAYTVKCLANSSRNAAPTIGTPASCKKSNGSPLPPHCIEVVNFPFLIDTRDCCMHQFSLHLIADCGLAIADFEFLFRNPQSTFHIQSAAACTRCCE